MTSAYHGALSVSQFCKEGIMNNLKCVLRLHGEITRSAFLKLSAFLEGQPERPTDTWEDSFGFDDLGDHEIPPAMKEYLRDNDIAYAWISSLGETHPSLCEYRNPVCGVGRCVISFGTIMIPLNSGNTSYAAKGLKDLMKMMETKLTIIEDIPGIVLSKQELGTVLAALRFWQYHSQNFGLRPEKSIIDIATNDDEHPALTMSEIDDLCERLNT